MDRDSLSPTSSKTETLTSTFEPRPLLVEVPALVRVGAQPLQSGHCYHSRGLPTVGVPVGSGAALRWRVGVLVGVGAAPTSYPRPRQRAQQSERPDRDHDCV